MPKGQSEVVTTPQAAAAEATQSDPDVPTFTLRASDRSELRGFIQIVQNAQALGFSRERVSELQSILRNFELYEERHRK